MVKILFGFLMLLLVVVAQAKTVEQPQMMEFKNFL
jgi:hypothetical protein